MDRELLATIAAVLGLVTAGLELGVFQAAGRRTILDGLTFADLLACVDGLAASSSGAEVPLTA